tara:strand:+ start:840 stop:1469 length:630 start_codon:yes stop_codon:yes gene_type:complete
MTILKKAAMFGLDARIALAIFGALSVISGAALYSAIQKSQVVSFYTSFNEVVKASEAYLLDTGSFIKTSAASSDTMAIRLLGENTDSDPSWSGPYLPYPVKSEHELEYTFLGNAYSLLIKEHPGVWTTAENAFPEACDGSTTACYEWISLYANSVAESNEVVRLFNALDKEYDNSDGYNVGNVRHKKIASGNTYRIYIKGMLKGSGNPS